MSKQSDDSILIITMAPPATSTGGEITMRPPTTSAGGEISYTQFSRVAMGTGWAHDFAADARSARRAARLRELIAASDAQRRAREPRIVVDVDVDLEAGFDAWTNER